MAMHPVLTSDLKTENGTKTPVPPIPIEILEDPWTPAWEVARIAMEVVRTAAEPA